MDSRVQSISEATVVQNSHRAFTIIELMVAMAVLSLVLVLTAQIVRSSGNLVTHSRERIETFQEARNAFESVTGRLSQAMLNTYSDYADATGQSRTVNNSSTFVPKQYLRQSDLQFVSGPSSGANGLLSGVNGLISPTQSIFFQAPLGITNNVHSLPSLLNGTGYFLQFSDDASERPLFLASGSRIPLRYRFRLMELRQPAENFSLYSLGTAGSAHNKWFTDALRYQEPNKGHAYRRVVAENVVAFIILPKRSPNDPVPNKAPETLTPGDFNYDSKRYENISDDYAKASRNQLPPVVTIVMVVVDEKDAARLALSSGSTPPLELSVGSNFKDDQKIMEDLKDFEKQLTAKHVNYRIFSTDVSVLQAKWSEDTWTN